MVFTYGTLTYNRRPLTDDVALVVIGHALPQTAVEREEFARKVLPYTQGELAAQKDSCPIRKLEQMTPKVSCLKRTIPGFRIRHAILSGVTSVEGSVRNLSRDLAEFLIAAGSIAVIAEGFDSESAKLLEEYGILPLRAGQPLEEDTFLLVSNIREDLMANRDELDAVVVFEDRMEKIPLSYES